MAKFRGNLYWQRCVNLLVHNKFPCLNNEKKFVQGTYVATWKHGCGENIKILASHAKILGFK
jgi:hypothetical protein